MKVRNYTEWNKYNKLEITLESPKTESSKFSMAVQIGSREGMGRDLHMIRCFAQVTVGLIDLVQYWHLSLKTGVARYWISFWMAIVPIHPLSKALSHIHNQHLMFRMCFRDWCLLASIILRYDNFELHPNWLIRSNHDCLMSLVTMMTHLHFPMAVTRRGVSLWCEVWLL